jgi:hypothetical protein
MRVDRRVPAAWIAIGVAIGVASALTVGAAIGLALAGPAAAGTFGANLRVNQSGDGYHQTDPEIVRGPEGNLYVVWEDWRHSTGSVYCARSLDGGASFEPEIRIDPASLPGYGTPMLVRWPCLGVDGNGIVYAAWVMWEPGRMGRVFCARSVDEGATFDPPVLVSDSEVGDRAWPEMTGDPAGGVHIVWCDFRNSPDIVDLYVSYSQNGTAFRPNVKANRQVVGPTCTPPLPDIAMGGDPAVVHLVWRQTNAGWSRWIYAARSLDRGLTWELPVEVSHDPWFFDG